MTPARERSLAWYQTTVFRSACLAMLIVCGGYLGSALSLRQALRGFSSMTRDAELDSALDAYMLTLKQLDGQIRANILLTLAHSTPAAGWESLDAASILPLLDAAGIKALSPLSELHIAAIPGSRGKTGLLPHWVSRTELQVGTYRIQIPGSEIKASFVDAQRIKQRYALMQATWDAEIAPTLLLTQVLIFLATIACIGSVLFLLVRRYIADAQKVLSGLERWSQSDSAFRLPLPLSGELGVIATQFNQMAEEVEANRRRSLSLEKIASWQTMARKLAHEIKNPLTPIQMMVSHLQRSYKGEDPAFTALLQDATAVVTTEVKTLRNMVDHFSQFARLPDPEFVTNDLREICQQVVDVQTLTFPHHKMSFDTALAAAPLAMDAPLIRQLLTNLIKNAAEASGERQANIAVRLGKDARGYQIEVQDDGPGIPQLDLNRVFEAYFTTKHTGPSPGMGLGLAICQKIALDHGGDLRVTSQAGETIFRLDLPFVPAREPKP